MTTKLSPREAVKAFQVSRATIMRALSAGKISAEKTVEGHWLIDPAELSRVYTPRSTPKAASQPEPDHVSRVETTADHDLLARLSRTEAELKAEREKVALLQSNLDDLRRMLPPPDAMKSKRWWFW